MSGTSATAHEGVVVMEQWAAGDPAALLEPPLAPGRVAALAVGEAATAGVRLEVPGVVGLLVIRADPERVPLADALDEVLGLALPEPLASSAAGTRRLRWISPDEWWLSCPPEELADVERRLRAALGEAPGAALTNVTGGWCVLALGGPGARGVLERSTSLDVDPRAFGPGRVASTVFAKTNATLANLGDGRYEVICRRSFADYVARWIATAARSEGFALGEAR